MEKVLTYAEMRLADSYTMQNCGISSAELMHRAGLAIADEVEKAALKLNVKDVLVVCGTGNNGGDGYVCAEELRKRGFNVQIYAFDGNLSPDCARQKSLCKCAYSRHICGSIIVDCMFGTGFSREVSGEFKEVIEKINKSGAYIISADIPSGLNGDNGRICGSAVNADLTVAIGELKAGMFLGDGLDVCGAIVRRDIGIICPQTSFIEIYSCGDIAKFYPKRRRNSHKGTYGSANLIAGSDKYIGAAALGCEAALKSGCGYVKLTTTEKVRLSLAPRFPQVIFCDEPDFTSNAIAIGMGCGVSEKLYGTVKELLINYDGALVIDADGLNALSKFGADVLKDKKCKVILTPHVKEFSRLSGLTIDEILNDPITAAKAFALKYNVTIILKNAVSVITDGEAVALNVRGNTALSKGGSGDMLSGYLCGTLARGIAPFDAAVCSTYTLGVAAEIAGEQKTEYCATAKDILKNLHFSVKRLTE